MYVSSDDVPLLWTQQPRFIEIMRSGTRFTHPHYFWDQSDKLASLLNRLSEDTTAFGPNAEYLEAREVLSQLLNDSQCYSSLTREQLRQLEPHVRVFIDKVQNVDNFVLELDEKRRQMSLKQSSKKRGRSEDEEESYESVATIKRRRETCGSQMMDMETMFNAPFQPVSPWIQAPPSQPVLWSESFNV